MAEEKVRGMVETLIQTRGLIRAGIHTRHEQDVLAYRLRASKSVADAYNSVGTVLFTNTLKNRMYSHASLDGSPQRQTVQSYVGWTLFSFNPDKVKEVAGWSPSSNRPFFLRVDRKIAAVPATDSSPAVPSFWETGREITMVSPADVQYTPQALQTLEFEVPAVAGAAGGGQPPAEALVLRLPSTSHSIRIENLGSGDVFVSLAKGTEFRTLQAGKEITTGQGKASELSFGAASNTKVVVTFALANRYLGG